MNARQKRFCDEYLISLNATDAAKKAGYKGNYVGQNADKLLKNTKIQSYLEERLAEKETALIADQDDILKLLTRIVMGKEQGTALVGIGQGAQEVEQVPPTNTEKIRAAEILGKYYKLFTDRQEIQLTGAVEFIDDISGGDTS
ncbi:terminase small subunit [Exiguobacterium sp. s138]|uniref:terminase small subunit n=1 Tax=Exiguobacterium sp. s138 TaxID=2751202 RepID=UPI001BE94991|nr:terminase small subunit [Exiguobacterium sp. s138]